MIINHITFICQDIQRSAALFCDLFKAVEIYSSEENTFSLSQEKFLLIDNLWVALMQGPSQSQSYNHVAFTVTEEELPLLQAKIEAWDLKIVPGRARKPEEGQSLYFFDFDNHLFELHTGDLKTRLNFYMRARSNEKR